ncbi:uncharacterized protein [Penaeus vannamei]|uniref:uncharacterized protein n=1 Tax=Penaeus vannamei TaxID=6689 RepID=UPI00387FA5C9
MKRGKTPGEDGISIDLILDAGEIAKPRELAGFRCGFSTTDHIHTLTQIREKVNEYRKPLCMAFIDYEKAFNSVQIAAVLGSTTGSRADNIVLFSESANEMQQLINDLNRENLKVGLKMNKKKTKIMLNSRVQIEQIHVQSEALEPKRSDEGDVDQGTKVEDIFGSTKKKKWQWEGHVCRRQDDRWTKKVTDWTTDNIKKPRARPVTRWRDEITKFGGQDWGKKQDRETCNIKAKMIFDTSSKHPCVPRSRPVSN